MEMVCEHNLEPSYDPSDPRLGTWARCLWTPGDCGADIYGGHTNTNGPVAVMYLSDMISTPLTLDFAIGNANGGGDYGATIDNTFTPTKANIPSVMDQIANYTGDSDFTKEISETVHFLWAGNNDIIYNAKHVLPWPTDNSANADVFAGYLYEAVENLINAGAKYLFVVGIYSKQVAPIMTYFGGLAPSSESDAVGDAIQAWNAAAKAKLASFGSNVMYYDPGTIMMDIWNNPSNYGIEFYINGTACDTSLANHDA